MINLFRSSIFWLVLILIIILVVIFWRVRINIPKIVRSFQKDSSGIRGGFSTGPEVRLRNDIHRFAQKQHLASLLFSLDEIAIVPRVLTPLIQASNSIELAPTDSVSLTVPYIPDWPELGSIYRASTMTLTEALQGGANIILAGHPGSGKTVALAWLAISLSRNDPGLGILSGFLPLYIHATDILPRLKDLNEALDTTSDIRSDNPLETGQGTRNKTQIGSESLDILINAISTYVSPLTIPRLSGIVRAALEKQRAILLLDRTDELPPNQAAVITEFIRSLLLSYPKLRVITALSFESLAGLPEIGFSLLAMAAWGEYERESLLNRWSDLWSKWIIPLEKHRLKMIDPHYLNSWLKGNSTMLRPIEYVLKVWAAYSGDILGTDGPSSIEAYIRRMTSGVSKPQAGLERFALQIVDEMGYSTNPHELDRLFSEYDASSRPSAASLPKEDSDEDTPAGSNKPTRIKAVTGVDTLADNGFLVSYASSQYGFSHPVICGYLAGNALIYTGIIKQILSQSQWVGKTLAMHYFARNGDVAPLINNMLQEDDIIHTNHLIIARWLQIAPKNRQWRSSILRTLATILQKEKETLSLAAKIISALAFSGDPGVSIYFRQLLNSNHPNLKPLAALGCGIQGEKKAIEELNSMLQEQSPSSIRAASLSLAAIGDKQSLEILASTLLNGSELARRYAAEALANNSVEGHPALKEGSTMEDLLVRRSVAFGLIRVNQPWAIKIVENLQLEDNEWVVRNAALQAFDEYKRKINYAPKPLVDPTELEWLNAYAAKVRTSVAPGKPAESLILRALTNGSPDEMLYALEYLRNKCDPRAITHIHAAYTKNSGEIKDFAYYVLWLMMISGIKLPVEIRFNI